MTATTTAADIIAVKSCIRGAYLWAHDSGDVILWPDEASSQDDDGAKALQRWHVGADVIEALIDACALDGLA